MRKVIVIPTYWSRDRASSWQEGDAVYDHPTPIDEEGTLQRTLESMKILTRKDFKLVLLICPTTPEVEAPAERQVRNIVAKTGLAAETYIFTPSDLERMRQIFSREKASHSALSLLNICGYGNVRNICLLVADVLAADAAILIDDDEVFELSDFVERSTEFLGKRIFGAVVHGVAGYYVNKHNQYYDDVVSESWMTYWDRFGTKARAFDEIIGCQPRIKRTPFAFGGAMIMHKDLFQCVPFDPDITRGEDIDYLINSRMYGYSFFLDNTLSIKHLPVPKKHPQWKRIREDIYRFVYERAKIDSQYKTGNMVMVTAEDFDPYPGEFLRDTLDEKIFRSNTMLAVDYMMRGDEEGCRESLNNISIARREARPNYDPFSRYRGRQKDWEELTGIIASKRYGLRKIMEEHNLTKEPIVTDEGHHRAMTEEAKIKILKTTFPIGLSDERWAQTAPEFFVKTYYEGDTIFRAGDYNDTLYVILKGEIQLISQSDDESAEVEIARLVKGDVLGESCLTYQTFTLTGIADQFTELLGIREKSFRALCEENPTNGLKFYRLILEKTTGKLRNENVQKTQRKEHVDRENFV